ncbi:MAG: twin-arginine translocation signal domain-containing protein, partial [Woeseiaceae bacterium]
MKRREFLQSTGAAGIAAATAPYTRTRRSTATEWT